MTRAPSPAGPRRRGAVGATDTVNVRVVKAGGGYLACGLDLKIGG
ncbi:hypothetical protein [Solihabitans fulvus]|nr:hypothetical protein [Solihabitans fulvus]